MVKFSELIVVLSAVSLSGCIAVKAVGTTARVAGSAASTAVGVTGDVVGGAAYAVSGSEDDDSD
jgi:hypothetical protein